MSEVGEIGPEELEAAADMLDLLMEGSFYDKQEKARKYLKEADNVPI